MISLLLKVIVDSVLGYLVWEKNRRYGGSTRDMEDEAKDSDLARKDCIV